MINWLLLVPVALVVIVLANLLARAAVDGKANLSTNTPKPEALSRPANVANVLVRAEIPVLVAVGPFFLFTSPLTVFALALIPLLWGVRWMARGYLLPRTPLDWPIAFMAIMLPMGLLVSPYFSWGAGKAAFLVYCIALYYALVDWVTGPHRFDLALTLYLLAGGGLALLALVGTDWQYKLPFLGDLTQALPQIANFLSRDQIGFHPNIVAGALLWVIFPLLAVVLRRRTSDEASERSSRLSSMIYDPRLAAVLTLLTAGTLLLTQSRGALVSAAAGFGLLAWLRWPRLRPVVAIASVVAIALVSMAVTMEISAGKQAVSASDFSVSAADNFAVRIDTWHSALWALSQHPVEGVGLDAFRHLLPTTYPAASIPNTYDIGHAHNQFIQAALDLGLPGLLGYLALWFAAWRMVWHMLRAGGTTRAFPWGKTHPRQGSAPALPSDQTYDLRSTIYDLLLVGFASALFASFLHGMIDVVVMVSKPGVLFWAMLALISALWRLTANGRVSTLQE